MAYYIRDNLPQAAVLGMRRPSINEFYLSSYTLSIYAGCELGCAYCDGWAYTQRPLNETIRVPLDLPQRLAGELDQIDRGDLIGITALSDPYQPAEQTYRITRQVLQMLAERQQPCVIMTKNPGILEDIPLLRRLNEESLAIVMITLLTTDPHLSARLEGKAAPPGLRLDMIAALKQAGIPVGVALLPVIPYVNDTHHALRALLRACADAEADFVLWDYLHIPNDRHRARIDEMLARVGTYPASYYQDIYQDRALVDAAYRAERDQAIITRSDGLGLEPRVPHRLFAGKLNPHNEAALVLKHTAFRDRVQGRTNLAQQHRVLADRIYRREATPEEIRASTIWPTLQRIFDSDEPVLQH